MAVIGKAVSAIFGGGSSAPEPAAAPTIVNLPTPEAAAAATSPVGQRSTARGSQSSFLSSASSPTGSIGGSGKTLLGQ